MTLRLLERFPGIITVCCNGTASYKYLKRYFPELFLREFPSIIQMPSTSPAAARLSYDQKLPGIRGGDSPAPQRRGGIRPGSFEGNARKVPISVSREVFAPAAFRRATKAFFCVAMARSTSGVVPFGSR